MGRRVDESPWLPGRDKSQIFSSYSCPTFLTPHRTSHPHPTNLPQQTSESWNSRGWWFLYSGRWRRWRTFPSHSCLGLWVRHVLLASVLNLKDVETSVHVVCGLFRAVNNVLSLSDVTSEVNSDRPTRRPYHQVHHCLYRKIIWVLNQMTKGILNKHF